MSTAAQAQLVLRTHALAQVFADIAVTRMAGMPLLNTRLQVETVGFELANADLAANGDVDAVAGSPAAECGALGVLVAPWFMNLVWLPADRCDRPHAVGRARTHTLNGQAFEFIGAHEDRIGSFEACSLFSPMFEFADHATARDTALAVLAALRKPTPPAAEPRPARRSFLLGRGGRNGHGAELAR